MSEQPIVQRKRDHIEISLNQASQFDSRQTGLGDYWFMHQALPEMDFDAISLDCEILGKKLSAPVFIASMTGGPDLGLSINRNLAEAAQQLGLAMGVGSQRVTFAQPETLASFQLRDVAPDILLLSNLGAVQLNYGFALEQCLQAVSQIGADALYFHLNPLQEVIQPEGDRNFAGLLDQMAAICRQAPFPILAKECGCGISAEVAARLLAAGLAGVEVSGAGGTSWALIESQRAAAPRLRQLGQTFANWGIPTSLSIQLCRQADPNWLLIASGGIRTGLDAAKAIALGADAVSLAHPLLSPATQSAAAVTEKLELFLLEMKVAMFCAGARNLQELRTLPLYR